MRIVVATRNPAKVATLADALSGSVEVIGLPPGAALAPGVEVALEDGETIESIAAAKAVAWSRALPGAWVVATDGGLLIPALGVAWNPARTRRFAGERANDLDRARALLALTAHLQGADRRIAWREAAALARDGEIRGLWSAESIPGMLARDVDPELVASGRGFWVPALWICPEAGGRRLAALSAEEQTSRDDHWRRLAAAIRETVANLGATRH